MKHEGGPVQRINLDTLPVNNDRQIVQFVCRIHQDGQVTGHCLCTCLPLSFVFLFAIVMPFSLTSTPQERVGVHTSHHNFPSQIQIDRVVREGKGYPTTEEELAEHHANEAALLQNFR